MSKARFGRACAPDRIPVGTGIAGTAAAEKRALVVTHAGEPGPEHRSHRSEMAVPMISGGELIGILLAQSAHRWAFDDAAVGAMQRAARGVGAVLRALKIRGDLVAVIGHELRAPITAIHGSVRTLIRGRHRLSDTEAAGFLRVIDRQAVRMARLVEPKGAVYAVDIQTEMLDLLTNRMAELGITNVRPVLGTITDPRLQINSVDLVLMVDVYHEFSHPYEMMEAICRGLKPGGRVVFVEFRGEDPTVPIKRVHKMTEAQVRKEMSVQPLEWFETIKVLPRQHIIVFRKKATR